MFWFVGDMKKSEKLAVYERFFHKISLAVLSQNQKSLQEALHIIDSWSYAHRMGNGELSEKEQEKAVEVRIKQMSDFLERKSDA